MDEAESAKAIQDLLQNLGYRAQIFEDNSVASAASGLKFLVIPYPSSIQFRCGITANQEDPFDIRFANEFNREVRFCKTYLEENSLVMEWDWLVDLSRDDRTEIFDKAINYWELSLATLVERVRTGRKLETSQ